jgi:hypothetical protein
MEYKKAIVEMTLGSGQSHLGQDGIKIILNLSQLGINDCNPKPRCQKIF